MKGNRILWFVVFAMVFAFCIEAFADSISEDNEKLKDVNKQIESIQAKIDENTAKNKGLTESIGDLDESIFLIQEAMKLLDKDIDSTMKDIKQKEEELSEAESNIEGKTEVMNSRLRVMYKNKEIGYIEVLLDSEDFSDLITRLDMVKKIYTHDVNLLKYMEEQKELIFVRKQELEANRLRLVNSKNEKNAKSQSLEVNRGMLERDKEALVKNTAELEKAEDELIDLAKKIEEEIRRKQSDAAYIGGIMTWPSPGYTSITSEFGYRIHPILKTRKLHTGIDIGVPANSTIVAAQSGIVIAAGYNGGYGKIVMIDHGGGIVTLYAHNNTLLVGEGDKVEKGQAISKSGSTGLSTGPHLHFEVRENGKYVNPIPWVKGN
ncbi:MAG TPA: peptidoglycan DD-metalloendopeptidase family protein [Clostridia bacterium]|nr:peptidoglycan DD-metalloendopeptidase family protein [Clostridia bacterium]